MQVDGQDMLLRLGRIHFGNMQAECTIALTLKTVVRRCRRLTFGINISGSAFGEGRLVHFGLLPSTRWHRPEFDFAEAENNWACCYFVLETTLQMYSIQGQPFSGDRCFGSILYSTGHA